MSAFASCFITTGEACRRPGGARQADDRDEGRDGQLRLAPSGRKAGFREIATMEHRRRDLVEHVSVTPSGDPSGLAQELAARLDR
jgi:hypothetical protein